MKKTTSIVFTGDIGFDRYMDRKWEDPQLLSQEVNPAFTREDFIDWLFKQKKSRKYLK